MSSVVIVPFSIFALVTASFASVVAIAIFAVPLKLAVPVIGPVSAIFLAVCNAVAVPAFPLILPPIVEEKVFVPAIVWFVVVRTNAVESIPSSRLESDAVPLTAKYLASLYHLSQISSSEFGSSVEDIRHTTERDSPGVSVFIPTLPVIYEALSGFVPLIHFHAKFTSDPLL